MKRAIIKIRNEYLHGPLWTYDPELDLPTEDYEPVTSDLEIAAISQEINDLYSSFFEPDSHGETLWFNEAERVHNKDKMLNLLRKLNQRLAEINDGSFTVSDMATPFYKSL